MIPRSLRTSRSLWTITTAVWMVGIPMGWSLSTSSTTKKSPSDFALQSGTWDFKGHPIAYERTVTTSNDNTKSAPVLLLNGFGMGSFHQHRLMESLLNQQHDDNDASTSRTIYGMDYLGQGKSWPIDCEDGQSDAERDLQYSGSMWVDQIINGMEQILAMEASSSSSSQQQQQAAVHLVGNSVGGHLAACVAATRPDLVASVTLLNATPVWGLNLPGWSGRLPAPALPRAIGRALFDTMRDPGTIREFLDATYVHAAAYANTDSDHDDTLARKVQACTEGPGGHAAFASILWSPPVTVELPGSGERVGFYEALEAIQCDVLLCFGESDPWCKPAFARRMLDSLSKRRNGCAERYVGLSDVGHCPNHEAPQATAKILSAWLSADSDRKSAPLLSSKQSEKIQETWGYTTAQELSRREIPLSLADTVAVKFL